MTVPVLRTERLLLRGLTLDDAPRIQQLASVWEVASTTLSMPHPYVDGMAEVWINAAADAWAARTRLTLAITTDADGMIGGIGLNLVPKHRHAELGYWIGQPFWGRGFATEAARAMIGFGFGELGMNRILARCFSRNAASGRVLRKLGMTHEGTLREHFLRWDRFEDTECYAILARDGHAAEMVKP